VSVGNLRELTRQLEARRSALDSRIVANSRATAYLYQVLIVYDMLESIECMICSMQSIGSKVEGTVVETDRNPEFASAPEF
jgi:hypothetical protein